MNNFKQVLVTAAVAAAVSALVFLVGFRLVGNQSVDSLGAVGLTRFPNSGIAARALQITTTPGTVTSFTDGTLSVTGVVTLSSSNATGTLSLSNNGGALLGKLTLSGGTVSLATAAGGPVISAANVCEKNRVLTNPDWSALTTTTLPTAASLIAYCLDNVGDETWIYLYNSSLSTTTPIAFGGTYATGTRLYAASSTESTASINSIKVAQSQFAKLTFVAASSTGVDVFYEVFR